MKLAIRVRPGARADRVGGCWDGPRGPALLVAVRARAVDGKANEAVVAALAEAFGLRRSEVTIASGHRGRDKTVELTGDDDALRELAEKLTGPTPS
ncbi:DUF167 domain-containing protein [Pseudonocardia acaciae]|uniref:DUF167 domain-containing protein n=1 Tax=Pseudonocardia acaciae TaxID=551276 RepID=UPI00048E8CD4|nr:DUF167 domain-containing protein [Pseudonocardia acaciae]